MPSFAGRLFQVFAAPTFPDLEKTRQCRLLNLLVWVAILGILSVLLAGLATSTTEIAYYLRVASILPFTAASLWFMKRGDVQTGSYIFAFSFWVYITYLLISSDPAATRINFAFYYPTIIAAGLLLGARGALLFFALSAVSGITLFNLSQSGWPFESLVTFNPPRNMINLVIGILIAAAFTAVAVDRLNKAIGQASTEKVSREKSESNLRQERDLVQALMKASTVVSGSLVFEEILDNIMEQISSVVPSDAVNIMVVEGVDARIVRWRGYDKFNAEKNVANKVFKIEQTPNLKKMFERGEPAGEANTVNAPNWVRGKEFSWLKSYVGVPIRVREKVVGFLNVDSAAPDSYTSHQMQALQALAGSAAAAIENSQLFKQVQEYSGELESALIDTTLALAKTLDVRDSFTANHSQVMAVRAQKIFRLLGGSERDVMLISLAAQLHDIGKIGVPDEILHKAAALSDGEWKIIKKHPEVGAEIVKRVKGLGEVADIVQSHQEHFDGNGYPRGLKGEEIPLAARIIGVVDAYGAMTEDRAYRKALSRKEAYAELRRNSGSQFDPKVVDAFFQLMPED